MPTPAILDFEALIAPIPGDDPSGGSVPFTLRERLDIARKEINPEDFKANDPMRPAEAKHADWTWIVIQTNEILRATSKDLMIVARLIEAMTHCHGFAGLRDGVRLLRRLIEEAWDRIRPIIEEPADLEARASTMIWLDDSSRGARFPTTIRTTTILDGPGGSISWLDWSSSQTAKARVPADEVEKRIAASLRETCALIAEDIDEIVAEMTQLMVLLEAKMGREAPSLGQVRQAVMECRTLALQILERKGPAPIVAGDADPEAGEGEVSADETSDAGKTSISKAINNRAQAYQRLIEIADALEKLEPHSPIPFVIRRAIELGQLSFPELMKELISDASVLGDMSRNLGIKELR